jgi:hypothetical protein
MGFTWVRRRFAGGPVPAPGVKARQLGDTRRLRAKAMKKPLKSGQRFR